MSPTSPSTQRENVGDRMVPPPMQGRCFTHRIEVRVGDCDPAGLWRYDALARAVQDIAADDTADAQLRSPGWVVRRSVVHTTTPAHYREHLEVSTWCGGVGRRWAERRARFVGDRGAFIDVAALWVHVDPTTGRPLRLPDDFIELYASAAAGREVNARLRHGDPPAEVTRAERPDTSGTLVGPFGRRPWPLRATDFDLLGHVNNAASWSVVEELLAARIAAGARSAALRRGRAEVEYRGAISPGEHPELCWRSTADGGADEAAPWAGGAEAWLVVADADAEPGADSPEVRVSAKMMDLPADAPDSP